MTREGSVIDTENLFVSGITKDFDAMDLEATVQMEILNLISYQKVRISRCSAQERLSGVKFCSGADFLPVLLLS
jgi:hypothetical protein